jgi:hypothetical protein
MIEVLDLTVRARQLIGLADHHVPEIRDPCRLERARPRRLVDPPDQRGLVPHRPRPVLVEPADGLNKLPLQSVSKQL